MLEVDSMEFVVYLTFRCNFKCDMCTQGSEFREQTMSELCAEDWNILFDSLTKKIEHPRIVFMGGEPLLHKDFDSIIINAWKKGIYPHVITNGYFLDKHLDTILKTNTGLTISVHGLENTQNSLTHTKDSFSKTIKILEKIKSSKSYGRKIFCRVNSVILPDNIDEAIQFTEFFEQFNLTDLVLNHPRYTSYQTEEETLKICNNLGLNSPQKLHLHTNKDYIFNDEYINKVNEFFNFINKKYKGRKVVEYPAFSEQERLAYYNEKEVQNLRGVGVSSRLCVSPWNVPFILPNGEVATCLYSTCGNFIKQDFWDIWSSKKAEILRNELIQNGCLPSCKRCTCFYDAHYLRTENGIVNLKDGRKLVLDKEMTMLLPSSDGYFVFDIDRKSQDESIPVIAMPFQNEKQKRHIENCEKIIAKFSDMV